MKFKVVKVSSFTYKGRDYAEGDVVELSEADANRLTPCDYLKPVPEPKPAKKLEKPKK